MAKSEENDNPNLAGALRPSGGSSRIYPERSLLVREPGTRPGKGSRLPEEDEPSPEERVGLAVPVLHHRRPYRIRFDEMLGVRCATD